MPFLIPGGSSVDDRGKMKFINDLSCGLQPGVGMLVKRIYTIENHKPQLTRAWHAHKLEEKIMIVLKGVAVLSVVEVDDFNSPNRLSEVKRFVLNEGTPAALWVPSGWANGLRTLVQGTLILVLSSVTLEQAKTDDFRYPAGMWPVLPVMEEER